MNKKEPDASGSSRCNPKMFTAILNYKILLSKVHASNYAYLLTKTYFNHIIFSTEPDTPLIMTRTTSGHFFIRKYNMAETLKKHQQAMTIDEQIANLKAIGLQIDNEDYARRILGDISYFRLIKAFSLNLKPRNGNYFKGVTFNQIVDLYLFNANFRQLLFPLIERIEINARCRIANYISEHYGVLGYKDKENFVSEEYHRQFLDDIKEEIRRNLRAPFVKNFMDNYEGGELPMYALVEICSFGTLSKLYKNMKNPDKKAIAKSFGIGYTYYESWIESISYVRNICAHYGRIYNAKLAKKPILYKQYVESGIDNNRIFAVLLCISHIVDHDAHWDKLLDDIEDLIAKYSNIDISSMGFPKNWKELLNPQDNQLNG